MKKIVLATLIILGISSLVYAANVKLDVDKDLVDEYKDGGGTDAELSAIVNNHILETIATQKKEQMLSKYQDLGTYISNEFDSGDIEEIDRIHSCVFP